MFAPVAFVPVRLNVQTDFKVSPIAIADVSFFRYSERYGGKRGFLLFS